jgi:hypothetical protein
MDVLERAGDIDEALLAAPHDQTNRQFIAAWLRWRVRGRLLPKRSAVGLGDIKPLLRRVVLLELAGEDNIRIKVAGSQLRDHADFEATGRSLAEITPPERWPLRRWRVTEMASRPCGSWMINHDRQTQGSEGVTFETVTLPLEPDGPGKPRLLISHLAVVGGIYEPPIKGRPQLFRISSDFRFLDLGAAIPDRIEP